MQINLAIKKWLCSFSYIFTFLLGSCGLFEYTPYDINLEEDEKDSNRKNIERLAKYELQTNGSDGVVKFAFIADNQNYFAELEKGIEDVNEQDSIDFILNGGDFTEFGLPSEYEASFSIYERAQSPFMTVIGNHDYLGVGQPMFKEMYGAFNESFIFRRVKFILLDTNSLENQFNGKVPDVAWLSKEMSPSEDFDQIVIICHVGIFPEENALDQNLYPELDKLISETPSVLAVIHGHSHNYIVRYPYSNESVPSIQVNAMLNNEYTIFWIEDGQIKWERKKV
ncbi:metallophosphoesterase family protein [Sediminitomix flava]|uniref:3',5'-cyclic AMP phosphodiesterase CpdA n=1 Tax=Sediminitomix flava TaxID=379075 RepID=A0A315YWC3_SEDFL|nr:metallophosphoesterase [Sediminitomix flava]PWJ34149.1 3',5'-cyclic AMP phosphodiesterase CpdA [Sediminitomix flava]